MMRRSMHGALTAEHVQDHVHVHEQGQPDPHHDPRTCPLPTAVDRCD